MGDYSKAWVLLLEYVEKMALSDTTEVSLAALKALQVNLLNFDFKKADTDFFSFRK